MSTKRIFQSGRSRAVLISLALPAALLALSLVLNLGLTHAQSGSASGTIAHYGGVPRAHQVYVAAHSDPHQPPLASTNLATCEGGYSISGLGDGNPHPYFPLEQGTQSSNAAFPSAGDASDLHIRLEKNEDYYGAAGVVITEVTSLFIDEDEAWSRYQSGELDTITPPDSALDAIKASPVYSPQLQVYPAAGTYFYGFSNDVPPFDDPLVRGAFASAIDRERLISETLSGDELPALTLTPPRHFGHVDGYAAGIGRPYSPTVAMDLLAASGYTGTPTITLMVSTSSHHQAVAEAIREMWIETLGITVTLEDLEWSDYLDLLRNGSAAERPGVFRAGWNSDYPDSHNWHHDALGLWGAIARYDNPDYDALVEAAAGEHVTTTRLGLYEQAEATLVMTDTGIVPLYYYVRHSLARPDLVRTYRSFGGQHLDEWSLSGDTRPLEVVWEAPGSLDPALSWDIDYVEQLFLGLTDFDEDGNVVPELATGWEVSPDGTVYTFTMRSDVLWTDGYTVTAHDVEYGVLRSLDPATGSGYAYVLHIIENAQAYNEGSITDPNEVGVEALDDTHVRFTLESPAAYFPVIAGLPPARPQPSWAIEAHGGAWTDPSNIVTNGPYKLAYWDQMPYLRINKWGHGDPLSGATFVFSIEYRNDGGASADNCVITDTMLGGMTYISDTSGFPHTGTGSGPIVWNLGTLAAHSSSEFEVHVQVTAAPSETVTNRAEIATDDPNDQGSAWEKESEWSGHVEGPWMYVNYGDNRVGGAYPVGHTFWITVTDSVGSPKGTAAVSTTVGGGGPGTGWDDGFATESEDWSPSPPDIEPTDWVHYRSDDGYTNAVRVGTISGEVDTATDTASGTIEAPWLATQTLEGYAGGWGFPGWESFTVALDHTGRGDYFVDFSPTDLLPGMNIDALYEELDGDRVINLIWARWRVYLPVGLKNYTP